MTEKRMCARPGCPNEVVGPACKKYCSITCRKQDLQHKYQQRPDVKERLRKQASERRQQPGVWEREWERRQQPEVRERIREQNRAWWWRQQPEVMERIRERQRERRQQPERQTFLKTYYKVRNQQLSAAQREAAAAFARRCGFPEHLLKMATAILVILNDNSERSVGYKELCQLLSRRNVGSGLGQLLREGLIVQVGKDKSSAYTINPNHPVFKGDTGNGQP